MSKYFGTDGFRGEANIDLTVEHAFLIGKFLGSYYQSEKQAKVVIGKDTRRSSYMLEAGLVAGLAATGANVYLLHVTTTPSVSFITKSENFDCGIMISASHNPFYDNGIKLISGDGTKLKKQILDQIELYLDNKIDSVVLATKENIGFVKDYSKGRTKYIDYLLSVPIHNFSGYKVGLDCANGSASSIAKDVFIRFGAAVYDICNKPDGLNINVDCGSTHIENLQRFVIANSLDVGFAYDGDADRCIAVDNNGRIIDGDLILYTCGLLMKEKEELKDNCIVTTIMSNIGLYKALDKQEIIYEKTDVGDKNVYQCIKENDYSLGGEQSGHIIFSKHASTGDGILTSLKIMEVIAERKQKLSQIVEEVIIYPQVLKNIKVKDKNSFLKNTKIQEVINNCINELNGEGRILVRPSGTEPLVRIMVEAKSEEICQLYIDKIESIVLKEMK